MQETQVRSLGREDLLEEEMATHSSILAWRFPWTEERGGLQSMGSQSSTGMGNSTRWGKRDLVQIRKGQTWLECLGQGELMTPSEAGLSPVS